MAGAIAQSKAAFSTAAVTSIAVSFTAQAAGNAIWAVGHDGSGTSKAMTCADTANGSYGTQLDSVNDSLNGNTLRHWVKANIASGSNTVTNTLPGSDGFSGIYAAEVSGVTTTPVDGHAGNTQPSLGTGTNNITSTAATNTATAFMLGLTIQDSSSSAGHASVGTGFTIDSNFASGFWNLGTANAGITEFKASVAAASNAALFSNGLTAQTYNTVMVMLDESSGSNVSVNLTGQTATFTEGSLTETIAYTPSAQTATFTEGSITQSVSYGLTAQTGTLTEGSLTDAVSYGLTAQTATFSEGTITVSTGGDVSLNLGAQTATFTEGTISSALTAALTGQSMTSSQGTPTAALSYGLAAQTATFSEGTVTAQVTGDVAVQLSGLTASFSQGQITVTGADVIGPAQIPAGRSKRRYYVEVDGVSFPVQDAEEARGILERAKQLAREAAETSAVAIEKAQRFTTETIAPVKLAPPRIKASPELRLPLKSVRRSINKIYREKSVILELRMWLELEQRLLEDDEEAMLLLN